MVAAAPCGYLPGARSLSPVGESRRGRQTGPPERDPLYSLRIGVFEQRRTGCRSRDRELTRLDNRGACARKLGTSVRLVRRDRMGEERGCGVAAHQPVTDLGQLFRIRDRRQQVGQAGGGVGIKARRCLATQQCPLLVDTLGNMVTMVLTLAALAAPGLLAPGGTSRPADTAAAEMIDTGGAALIGKATFEQTPHGVLMYVEVAGLPPGPHGIHLHAVGACTPDGFTAATGHINPERGAAWPATSGGPGPRRPAQPVRRRRRFRAGGVLHGAGVGRRRRNAGAAGLAALAAPGLLAADTARR